MDDSDDREYSRAPELEDLATLCRALNREGARYLLIGGFAVILHGYVRGTKDVDLLIDPTPANVAIVKRAMAELPDNAAALLSDGDVAKYKVVRVADEIVVDLLAAACGITYDEALADGVDTFEILGVPVPVARKATLIRTKLTRRESDAVDVGFLRLRIEAEKEQG